MDERKLFEMSTRYLEKKKWIRPNHALIDNERHNWYAPLLDTNGWLREDLLLISKLPNNINADAIHMKSNCIIVESAHGTGTRALGLLIYSEDMLFELKEYVTINTGRHYTESQLNMIIIERSHIHIVLSLLVLNI